MRIAYFINQYPKVSHTFIRREIRALEGAGLQVMRYALRGWSADILDPADLEEQKRAHYVLQRGALLVVLHSLAYLLRHPVRLLRGVRRAIPSVIAGDRSPLHHLFSVAEAAVLCGWIRRDRVEHIHAHFGTNSAEIVMIASAMCGVPYSMTVHGSDEWDMPIRLRLRDKVRYARFVVAVSQYTRGQLMRWSRIEDQGKIHVVHCGLADEYLGAQIQPIPESPHLVCVGRLCKEKAQHLIIYAMTLLKKRGLNSHLTLVGDGPLRQDIESVVAKLGLEGDVTFAGWASEDQVRAHISDSRVLLLPSLAEGLPVVIMEAMALGRPVISTYVGGIPELIRSGEEGWLVPAGDVHALAESISQVLTAAPGDLVAMGAAAKMRVRDRHRSTAEADKLKRLFEGASSDEEELV